jgi:hypothetical protein
MQGELRTGVNEKDVAGHLDLMMSQRSHRGPGFSIPVLLYEPTGRLGAKVDQQEQWDRWDERSSYHQPPVILCVPDRQVEGASEEDAKCSPHF